MRVRPNNSFKPTPHRGVNSVLYATLHAVATPLRGGLTQALALLPHMTSAAEEYENFVSQVVSSLVGVEVFERKAYVGRISGRSIKVDVSFVLRVAGGANLLVLVECKHYNHRVPVDDVEEFHSKIDDIGAQKGILITTVGFQSGAIKAAKGRRIALALLTKEPQPGEIRYVMASAGERELPPRRENHEFLQGNIKGVLGTNSGGIRFESGGGLTGMLLVEAMASNAKEG